MVIFGTLGSPPPEGGTDGADVVVVGSSTTVVKAASNARRVLILVNDSDEAMYLGFGEAAVMNKGVRLNAAGGSLELNSTNMFFGAINGICTSGTKNLLLVQW